MVENKKGRDSWGYGLATLFILCGIGLLARNMGWLSPRWFHLIFSWQGLLILFGLFDLFRRRYLRGIVAIVVALCFIGEIYTSPLFMRLRPFMVPMLFLLIGFVILWKMRHGTRSDAPTNTVSRRCLGRYQGMRVEDGFLVAGGCFSGVRQIVLSPDLKGGDIRACFGSVSIDLRRTVIELGQAVYLNVSCQFGEIELMLPEDWDVRFECQTFAGEMNDKRWENRPVSADKRLVIQGWIVFGELRIR